MPLRGANSLPTIKRKQYIVTTWSETGTTTKDIAITPVSNRNKCIVEIGFYNTQDCSVNMVAAEMLDESTVRLSKGVVGAVGNTLYIIVTEYNNVKSKQTINTLGNGSTEVQTAISSVNPNKCITATSQKGTTGGSTTSLSTRGCRIINATTAGIVVHSTSTITMQILELL